MFGWKLKGYLLGLLNNWKEELSVDPELDKSIMSLEFHESWQKPSREEEMRNTREDYISNSNNVKYHLYLIYHFVFEFSLVDEDLIVWKGWEDCSVAVTVAWTRPPHTALDTRGRQSQGQHWTMDSSVQITVLSPGPAASVICPSGLF